MKIRVTLEPGSIEKAIKSLEKIHKSRDEKLEELCRILAVEQAVPELVARGYSGSVKVMAEPIEKGYRIVAAGQNVGFLEYGTGDKAGSGEMLGTAPVPVYPGSWSESHAGTYERYKATGAPAKADGSYRYEQEPKSGMFWAMKAMRDNLEKVAEEVFGK